MVLNANDSIIATAYANCWDYIESGNPGLLDSEYNAWFDIEFRELTGQQIIQVYGSEDFSIKFKSDFIISLEF